MPRLWIFGALCALCAVWWPASAARNRTLTHRHVRSATVHHVPVAPLRHRVALSLPKPPVRQLPPATPLPPTFYMPPTLYLPPTLPPVLPQTLPTLPRGYGGGGGTVGPPVGGSFGHPYLPGGSFGGGRPRGGSFGNR